MYIYTPFENMWRICRRNCHIFPQGILLQIHINAYVLLYKLYTYIL